VKRSWISDGGGKREEGGVEGCGKRVEQDCTGCKEVDRQHKSPPRYAISCLHLRRTHFKIPIGNWKAKLTLASPVPLQIASFPSGIFLVDAFSLSLKLRRPSWKTCKVIEQVLRCCFQLRKPHRLPPLYRIRYWHMGFIPSK